MTRLTARERQVCVFLCKGWENKEIAAKLGISPRTVEDHRIHIFKKYRVRNAVELVRAVYDIPDEAVA
jgi:two-component system, LuxR family, response regulator FixJ